MKPFALLFVITVSGCAGIGPERALSEYRAGAGLPADAPVVIVDLDDTIYEREVDRPMGGALQALQGLAHDHLIVYLTARPTIVKVPGVTHNRRDSEAFLREHGFPDGPLFTSSLGDWLFHGQGGGKRQSFRRMREYGVERVALAVGDRPHDLEAYRHNGHVPVERSVIILIEGVDETDPDRAGLPDDTLSRSLPGSGDAWPRIHQAYRRGAMEEGTDWVVVQEPGA